MNMSRICLAAIITSVVWLGACSGDIGPIVPTSVNPNSANPVGTTLPFGTYQSEIQTTAEWIQTLTAPQTATALAPTSILSDFQIDFTNRQGDCLEMEGYQVHIRQGFCISAPVTWVAPNVDGGMAGFLGTTPGQTLALLPDWASDASQCYLLIYVTTEASARGHLEVRFREYQARTDMAELTDIGVTNLGSLTMPGFTWQDQLGSRGGVYAALLGVNKLLHISVGGSICAIDQLLTVLDTLRFN